MSEKFGIGKCVIKYDPIHLRFVWNNLSTLVFCLQDPLCSIPVMQ